MTTLTQQGITALKQGNKLAALGLLRQATQNNPKDLSAWLWLSGAVDTDQERFDCLKKVLEIDPNNQTAQKGIAKLVSTGKLDIAQRNTNNIHVNSLENEIMDIDKSTSSTNMERSALDKTKEEKVFSLKPSLIPTLIVGGLILIIFIAGIFVLGPALSIYGNIQVVLFDLLLLLGFIILSFPLIRRMFTLLFTNYTLTTSRIIIESGILGRSHKTIPIQNIQDVSYKQNVFERFIGVGDVAGESAGEKGSIHLIDLPDCIERSQQILKLIDK